jgi:hypothetical protein
MQIRRAEKLENTLIKLRHELQSTRKELHASRQKNRDVEKSREVYKAKFKEQERINTHLEDELKKKL